MPNLAATLKDEIARVARREVRAEVQALKKASATYRHEIAALKKRVQSLEAETKRRTRTSATGLRRVEGDSDRQLRFSATRLAGLRAKLGLSAAKFALLAGVSPISVYKWESGKARPRRAQLEAIATVRGLGKRETAARLEALGETAKRA